MNRSVIIILLGILFLNIQAVHADEWEEIQKTAKNIRSVSAKFVQEKHMKILARPLLSQGRFFFSRPDSLRWEYVSPVKSILLMHNGKLKSYIEGKNGLVEDTKAKAQIMEVVTTEISSWLNGRFHDDPNFTASLETGSVDRIILTPKSKSFSNIIKSIELQISRKEGSIKTVKISEGSDSYTLIKFNEVRHNERIDEKLFREAE